MSSKQRLTIVLLAAGDVVVLILLCGSIGYGLLNMSSEQAVELPASLPTSTALATLPPTQTPTPTTTPTAAPRPTSTPRPLTEEEMPALDEIGQEVVTLRGLEQLQPVPRWVMTERAMRRRLADMFHDEGMGETIHFVTLTLVALDMLDPKADLSALLLDLLSEQVAGFYDAENGEIYLISNSDVLGALERSIFAHEMGHALQDQHFDLKALGIESTDWSSYYADPAIARRALIEGDSELIQEQHMELYFSSAEIVEFQQATGRADHFEWDAAPPVIREVMSFPYSHGSDFVEALYDQGGWQAVNDAYVAPPQSTEQILHPEHYVTGDQPVPVALSPLTATLGSEWHLIYDDTVGEFLLNLYLKNHIDPMRAAVAAEGWGGDRCTVYYSDVAGETVLVLHTVWDTLGDAGEFLDAYVAYVDARFSHSADQSAEELMCWEGKDALCVTWGESSVIVILGPGPKVVNELLTEVR